VLDFRSKFNKMFSSKLVGKTVPRNVKILLTGLAIVATVGLRVSFPAWWLSAATIYAPEQGISVSAMVCADILDSSPEIVNIDADCASLDWTALHHISGYPGCAFPAGEYFAQISQNDIFTDLLDTSGWVPSLTYDVAPAIPDDKKLYYRVQGRDPAVPGSLSSWSPVLTCGEDAGGGSGGGGVPLPTCADTGTCDIYCGDDVYVAYNETCPTETYVCEDGTVVTTLSDCDATPPPDSTCEETGTCDIYCGDDVYVAYNETCPTETYVCEDGTVVTTLSDCESSESDCEETGTCDIYCGDDVYVAWDETCPYEPEDEPDDEVGGGETDGEVTSGGGGHSSAPESQDSDKDGCSDEYEKLRGTDPNSPFSMDPNISDCDWVEHYEDVDLTDEDLSVRGGDYQDYEFLVTGAVNFEAAHDVHFALLDSDNFRINIETLDLKGQSVYGFENDVEVKDGTYKLIATTIGVDGESLVAQDYVDIDGCLGIGLDLTNFSGTWFDNNVPIEHEKDILGVDGRVFAYGTTTPGHVVKAYWNSVLLTSVVMADNSGFYVEPPGPLAPGEVHTLVLRSEDPEHPELKTAPLVIKFRLRQRISFWFYVSLLLLILASIYHVFERRKRSGLRKKLISSSKDNQKLLMALKQEIKSLTKYIYISGAVVVMLAIVVVYLIMANDILSEMKYFVHYDQPRSTWQKNLDVDMDTCRETAAFRHASQYRGVAKNLVSILDLQCMNTKILPAEEVDFTDLEDSSAKLEIETLAHFGVFDLDVLGDYNPMSLVSKAELVKSLVLARCERPIKQSGLAYYNDVDPDSWYQDYVVTATLDGFVQTAYSDEAKAGSFEESLETGAFEKGNFQPEHLMTRSEGLQIILRAFELDTEIETFANSFEDGFVYEDVSAGDNLYRFLNFAESKGLVRTWSDRMFNRI